MKYIFSILFVLFGVIALTAFTSNDKEVKYSCDPQTEEAVKNNINALSTLTLEEFVKYPFREQKAIFRSFSKEKQRGLWKEHLLKEAKNYEGEKSELLILYANNQQLAPESSATLIAIFGDEAKRIFTTLYGKEDHQKPSSYLIASSYTPSVMSCDCNCSNTSDWCGGGDTCDPVCWCQIDEVEYCGTLWLYVCDGYCDS